MVDVSRRGFVIGAGATTATVALSTVSFPSAAFSQSTPRFSALKLSKKLLKKPLTEWSEDIDGLTDRQRSSLYIKIEKDVKWLKGRVHGLMDQSWNKSQSGNTWLGLSERELNRLHFKEFKDIVSSYDNKARNAMITGKATIDHLVPIREEHNTRLETAHEDVLSKIRLVFGIKEEASLKPASPSVTKTAANNTNIIYTLG